MLSIFYGEMPEAIYNPAFFFKNSYEDSWITDPFCQKMIQDVDCSRVLGPRVIDSPVLDAIGRLLFCFSSLSQCLPVPVNLSCLS